MTEKMGFETTPRQFESYGKADWCTVDGQRVWTQSKVERQWLAELELTIRAGKVKSWIWQPGPYVLSYKYGGEQGHALYRPDAYVDWLDDGEFWYEIKNGRIEQKAGNNIKRFCLQYPEKRLVLVWKGKEPKPATEKKQKRRGTTRTQWDKIAKLVHHIWYLR